MKNVSEFTLSNDLEHVDAALVLHDKVFAEGKETLYNSKSEWLKRIAAGGYFAVCLDDSDVVGYAVCDIVDDGSFKIWLVGVDAAFRKRGIWSMLYAAVSQHAKNERRTYMLLNTFPAKFPAMYAFLQSVGAEIYKKEMVDGAEKCYAKIPI